MAKYRQSQQEDRQKAIARAETEHSSVEGQIVAIDDARPEAVAQRQIQELADNSPQVQQAIVPEASSPASLNSQPPIQMYDLGTGKTRDVTVTGASDSVTFEECTYNYVEYDDGDKKRTGTGTKSPASWAGWVVNSKGGRNATQLHVVNRRWGGLGGKSDGNIVPGTPAENSHHLHQAEKKFDEIAFKKGSTAVQNAKYECWATPKYGKAVDVSKGEKDFGDPTLLVRITTDSDSDDYPVTDGAEGLVIQDGS